MKTIIKLALAAAVVFIGTNAAFADDTQLRNRLDLQRQAAQRNQTTIGVYAHHRGIGADCATPKARGETRFEWRFNARGQRFGLFVPVK